MTAAAALILSLVWAASPDARPIDDQLTRTSLPVERLRTTAAALRLVFHDRADWEGAFYTPPETPVTAFRGAVPDDVLLPELALPRLFLYAPHYRAGEGLIPIRQMPVDTAEHYFHALIEAHLDRELRRPDSAHARAVRERAQTLLREVPPDSQLPAYLAAASDFGAHLLSIANEIERSVNRWRAADRDADRDVCALLTEPRSLFGLWRASFHTAPYPGTYFAADDDGTGRWHTTRQSLELRDKELLVREVFGDAWSGDPERDFAHLCAAPP